MSNGWSLYVIFLTVISLLGCAWLLAANRKAKSDDTTAAGETLGHEFDGLEEYNNPLPAWWSWLFVVTIIFAVVYLIAYPGLGNYPGMLGWTSVGQWEAEEERAAAAYGPIFERYYSQPIPALLADEKAVEIGSRLFAVNCSTCHGSDAQGGLGYPNLTDDDWLYGGEPETIVQTITHGRVGNMPPMGAVLKGEGEVTDLANYVLSLSGRDHDASAAARAEPAFAQLCAVCHLADGTGNRAVGAPNLTDDIWLHGGRLADIEYQIHTGRVNQMPAHRDLLSPERIHLLALYVFSLSADN
jgi:cytochrome c oxidase cbb3-type subunit 3